MLYFVRHGQTDANKNNLMQGHLDVPLNQNGIEQAYRAKEGLANVKIDKIYSSPLIRAYKTASIINENYNLQITTDDRLKEFDCGEAQGQYIKTWEEEKRNLFFASPELFGAESWDAFYNRVVSFLKEIESDDKDILIVSHSGVFRNIYRYIYNLKEVHFDLLTIKNASIIKIDPIAKEIFFD